MPCEKGTGVVKKIERDHARFKQIVRGKIKHELRKYITHGEMIGRKGRELVSIPLPQIEIPHFRYGQNGSGGAGQGDGEPGTPIGQGDQEAAGSGVGDQPGPHILIAADEEALARLCGHYIDNVKAYTQKEKVKNKYTGQQEDPDERLMRSIEEKIDIPESRKDDFRREIMNYIGALSLDGKKFDFKTNERLQKALELKLFEDQKDSIKLTSLVSSVIDAETQEKIDVVKSRLTHNYGYCDVCATDVLNYVASIFARGDVKSS